MLSLHNQTFSPKNDFDHDLVEELFARESAFAGLDDPYSFARPIVPELVASDDDLLAVDPVVFEKHEIPRPFGRTMCVEPARTVRFDSRCMRVLDMAHAGHRMYYWNGSWDCEQYYNLYLDDGENLVVQSVAVQPRNMQAIGVPKVLGKWQTNADLGTSWAHRLVERCFYGLTLQGPEDIPEGLSGLMESLTRLFTGKFGSTGDAGLDVSVVESEDAIAREGISVLECFRWAVKNWSDFKNAPVFRHFANLLGIAISVGFLPADWNDFHINTIKVWRLSQENRYQDIFSMTDAIVMATNYFVESALASWNQGNMLPFLYDKTTSTVLDETYEALTVVMPTVGSGEFYKSGGSWSDLMLKLEKAGVMYKNAVEVTPPGTIHRKILHERFLRIGQWILELTIARKSGLSVRQPDCVVLHGKPGCGKTGICLNIQKIHAAVMGSEYQPSQTALMQPGEAYHSSVFNYTKFLVYDDLGNRPLKYDPSLGAASMLQAVNNTPFVAVKAEVDLKGKVIPEVETVVATTNNRGLNIPLITCEVDSLYRRYRLVDMFVRPEYINSQGGIDSDKFAASPKFVKFNGKDFADLYTFDVCGAVQGGHEVMVRKTARGSVRLEGLNVAEYFMWEEILHREHYDQQTAHIERLNNCTFTLCEDCKKLACTCFKMDTEKKPVEQLDATRVTNQGALSDAIKKAAAESFEKAMIERVSGMFFIGQMIDYLYPTPYVAGKVTREFLNFVSKQDCMQWWYYIPDEMWQEWRPFFQKIAPVLKDVRTRRSIYLWRRINLYGIIGIVLSIYLLCFTERFWTGAFFGIIAAATVFYAGSYIASLHFRSYEIISARRNAIRELAKKHREEWSPKMQMLAAACTCVLNLSITGFGLWFAYDNFVRPHLKEMTTENVTPAEKEPDKPASPSDQSEVLPLEELITEDREVEEQGYMDLTDEELQRKEEKMDQWATRVSQFRSSYRNPNMTEDQMKRKIYKNLSSIFYQQEDKSWKFICDVFWLKTDFMLMSASDIPKKAVRAKIVDNDSPSSGSIVTLTPDDFRVWRGSYMALGHAIHRSKTDLTPYLNVTPTALKATFLHRNEDVKPDEEIAVDGTLVTDATGVNKIRWNWGDNETYFGACGGVYVSRGQNNPCILGIHFGCVTGEEHLGLSFLPTSSDITLAIREFLNDKSVLPASDAPEEWSTSINGQPSFTPSQEPAHSILEQAEWLNNNDVTNQGAVFRGIRNVTAFYKSRCIDTIAAEYIYDKYEIPRHGPPRFGRSMWPKSVRYSINPSPGLPRNHLKWAVEDYLDGFKSFPRYLLKHLCPLERDAILNGMDGVRFIDSMNWSTSMGLNYPGGKKAWVVDFLDENGCVKKYLRDEVWLEVVRSEEQLRKGIRVPWIFNAVPKDEPTLLTKEKVRLFLVAEIACTLLVRKYFTPVNRVLQMMTGVSECAVGMNCTSEDWEAVQQHLEKFDRTFDGDYSKYDLRKSAQVSLASYRIMIEIAALGGYSVDDLFLMTFIASELVRPLVNFNGHVVELDGSTPSGIPVTVNINGLDNSLFNRCAFCSVYPRSNVGDFRRYVAHVNYGDDFINSVSYWRQKFNFLSMQAYLEQFDTKITPGVKDAEGKRFIDRDKLVFLQRRSVKLPELPYRVGALREQSIIKPLASILRPKSDFEPTAALANNIDGALREWVYHGEATYEKRRAEMDEMMQQYNMRHMSSCIDKDYVTLLGELKDINS